MLYLPFPILIVSALICWGLSRTVKTRWLGALAALAALAALGLLLASSWGRSLPVISETYTWAEASNFSVILGLQLDGLSLLLALALLGGGTLGLWSLARTMTSGLYGYGGLFAAILLVFAGGLLALLSVDLMLLAFGWGVVILGSALARRASGADDEQPGAMVTLAQPGGLLLLGAVLLFGLARGGDFTTSILTDAPLSGVVFGAWLAAAAAAMGLPFFSRPAGGEGAPLQLQAVLLACGLPLLAGYSLLRLYSLGALGSSPWPELYHQLLLAFGAVTALSCGAAALRSSHFGAILSWQLSAQLGLVLVALGLGRNHAVIAALALLINAVLATLVAGMALGALVRHSGSESLKRQPRLAQPLRGPGVGYLCAAASAVGLPPLWGGWARAWLLDAGSSSPWLMPLVLLSSALLGLSYLGPLALFWRRSAHTQGDGEQRRRVDLPVLLAALGLALMGALPTEVWDKLLRVAAADTLPPAVDAVLSPALPARASELFLVVVVLILLLLLGRRSGGQARAAFTGGEPLSPDDGTPLAPVAMGFSLRWLALIARPIALHRALERSLDTASAALGWSLQIVSGRYYLTGVFVAMVLLLILMVA